MLKDRLREARKATGLTQKQVAEAIGITESAYCGYETGKRQPDVLKIKQISAVLGTTGDFLLETSLGGNEKKPTPYEQDGLEKIDLQIADIVLNLNPAKKQEALHFLQYLEAREDR